MSSPQAKPSDKLQPNLQDALRRAVTHHQRGELDAAQALYADVLAVAPGNFDALHLSGVLQHQRGQAAEALRLLGQALASNARSASAHSNYGIVLAALARHDEALAAFDAALALKSDYIEARFNRAAGLRRLGRPAEALADYDAVLALMPRHLDALVGRGNVLHELRRFEEAIESFERALTIKPDFAELVSNRGNAQWELRRFDAALASYDEAIVLKPDYAQGHNNRGNVLLDMNRPAEAFVSFDRALALAPDYLDAHINRGNALRDLSGPRQAIASYDAALARDAGNAEALWNKALAELSLGDFAAGWRDYEARWRRARALPRDFAVPQWLGENAAGKTILLHAEQGFGDSIQFVRYVPLLAQRGARVVLEAPTPLHPLLQALPGLAALIARGDALPPFDLHCPLLSLPLAFATDATNIPCAVPYLAPPASAAAKWAARLPDDGRLRVGLAWSGNPTHRNDHNRSLPLSRLAPLVDTPSVGLVSLQRDLRDADRLTIKTLQQIAACGEELADFADTAALIERLDLVIAVDTAVAHLAGALGKPLWVLLPHVADWRWLIDRTDCPWYPTARLYRQPAIGDWDSVLARLRSDLTALAAARRG